MTSPSMSRLARKLSRWSKEETNCGTIKISICIHHFQYYKFSGGGALVNPQCFLIDCFSKNTQECLQERQRMRNVRLVATFETRHESVKDAHAELRHSPLHEAQRLHVFVVANTLDDVTACAVNTRAQLMYVYTISLGAQHSATNLFALWPSSCPSPRRRRLVLTNTLWLSLERSDWLIRLASVKVEEVAFAASSGNELNWLNLQCMLYYM